MDKETRDKLNALILQVVSDYNVDFAEVMGRGRDLNLVRARQAVAKELRKRNLTIKEIAKMINKSPVMVQYYLKQEIGKIDI